MYIHRPSGSILFSLVCVCVCGGQYVREKTGRIDEIMDKGVGREEDAGATGSMCTRTMEE